MAYTTINKGSSYFNTKLYTGNGSTQSITGVGFQPDWVWIKNRSTTTAPVVYDAVRGATKDLYTSATDAEGTNANGVTSFNSDGFSVGSSGGVNGNTQNIVSWNWLGANTTVSNTSGTITSTVSANTTSGFSVVSWTANGSNGATIGHGLGSTPDVVISKRRSAIGDWLFGGTTINTIGGGSNKLLLLNSTAAIDTNNEVYQTFSSTTFQVGINAYINTNTSTMISYCFKSVKGYSKFGSYTGNGSTNGTFVFTGFSPAFVMFKRTDSTSGWGMFDNKREPFNLNDTRLLANTSGADDTSADNGIDFLSNGFKWRTASGWNASASYIYMAFAENPFVSATQIPTTAR